MNRGQTLIEVVVATGIIVVVLVGCLSLTTVAIKVGILTRQKAQALNLASQGIEGIRNIRDTYWLKSGNIDAKWNQFVGQFQGSDFNIYYNESKEKWEEKTGSPPDCFVETVDGMKFERKISLKDDSDDQEKKVEVTVSWQNNGSKEIKVSGYLTHWEDK